MAVGKGPYGWQRVRLEAPGFSHLLCDSTGLVVGALFRQGRKWRGYIKPDGPGYPVQVPPQRTLPEAKRYAQLLAGVS